MDPMPDDAKPVLYGEMESLKTGAPVWYRTGMYREGELKPTWGEWKAGTMRIVRRDAPLTGRGRTGPQYDKGAILTAGVEEEEVGFGFGDILPAAGDPAITGLAPENTSPVVLNKEEHYMELCHREIPPTPKRLKAAQLDF